jgi:Raf kinase inhibitor-like YbhB/YbcL family protein
MEMTMQLRSSAFSDGATIPRQFTCDGEDVSPPLEWSEAPPETRSFALLCDDPDAPAGTWHHWAVYDVPAFQVGLPQGSGRRRGEAAFKQALNDFKRMGYGGPCPPSGHGPHHYHFRLLALSVDHLSVHGRPTCQAVEREARQHVLAEAVLTALYKR